MGEPAYTVGVEEELQLVDPSSGALEGRAFAVLQRAPADQLKPEYQQTMLELNTSVCSGHAELLEQLVDRRALARERAAERGLAIAAAGLHPVGPYPPAQIGDDPRYWRMAERGGTVARELHIFGTHVHVGVPDRSAAIRATVGAAAYTPHLLALAASSPFHRGEDTKFDSFRTLLRDMFPRAGPPLPVSSAAEYDRLIAILSKSGRLRPGEDPISWDIRPSLHYPTVEFRFMDACPDVELSAAIAAVARALTAMFADRMPAHPTAIDMQLMRENRWRAARFGLDAEFYRLDPPAREQRDARAAIRALLDRIAPVVTRLGDASALDTIERVLEAGTAAARMREINERTRSYPAVLRWVVERTATPPLRGLPRPPAPGTPPGSGGSGPR